MKAQKEKPAAVTCGNINCWDYMNCHDMDTTKRCALWPPEPAAEPEEEEEDEDP